MFKRRDRYDRTRILSRAARARERGKPKEAVEELSKVLAVEPDNLDLHRQLAPLLAQLGRQREAWESYARAARVLVKQGYLDKARDLYRDALARVPDEVGPWLSYAELEASRDRTAAATEALRNARERFRGRRQRRKAVRILEALVRLEPRRADYQLELAALGAVTGRRAQSRAILARLAVNARGEALRRVRWLQLRYWPTPRSLYAWVRALG